MPVVVVRILGKRFAKLNPILTMKSFRFSGAKRLASSLLFLFLGLTLSSCILQQMTGEASLGSVRQRFTGQSKPAERSDGDLGGELGAFAVFVIQAVASSELKNFDPMSYTAPEPNNFFRSERFALMPGIQLARKGGKISDANGTDVTRLWYIEVPMYALYRHELPGKGLVFGGLGPYVGYGLGGNFKYTFNGQTTTFPAFDKTNGGFRRFDGGMAFTAGYRLPSTLQIRLAYELGLANIEPGQGNKVTNRMLSVNVGYSLNKVFGLNK